MRKRMALVLAAAMTVGAVTGCSEGGSTGKPTTAAAEGGASSEAAGGSAQSEAAPADPANYEVTEPITIKWWHALEDQYSGIVEQVVNDFNSSQDLITVEAEYIGSYSELNEALVAAHAAGTGLPAITVANTPYIAEYGASGLTENLDPYIEATGYDVADFGNGMLEAAKYDGTQVSLPFLISTQIMYYNKDILEKAGVELNADGKLDISSLDDFKAMLDKVKPVMGDGESPLSLPNTGDDPYRVWWATYYQLGGTPIVNDDGTEVTLDKDKAVEAAEFVKSLYDDGYVATGIDDHQKLFQSGKAGFLFGGTWAVGVMESTDGLNFNVQSFPQLFDEDHCWADSHTFILPVNGDRDEDETKAAVEFMVAACKDGGLTWAGSGQIPANTEVTGNEEYAALPYRSNYQDEVEKAVLPAKNPHFYAMKDGMIQSLDTIWTGTNDAATGIDALVDELSSNLE